ncbi:hypothetical protein METP2_01566 [Methanosarcinales archaeon]|jgi:hypothetical protein|nr:hypothetical protein METP2_01566 [Methanosarcinales archaeon]
MSEIKKKLDFELAIIISLTFLLFDKAIDFAEYSMEKYGGNIGISKAVLLSLIVVIYIIAIWHVTKASK